MPERVSTTVTKPTKDGLRKLMPVFDMSESAVAAKLLDEGVKRHLPKPPSAKGG